MKKLAIITVTAIVLLCTSGQPAFAEGHELESNLSEKTMDTVPVLERGSFPDFFKRSAGRMLRK